MRANGGERKGGKGEGSTVECGRKGNEKNSVLSEKVMDTTDSFFTNSRYHQKR